MTTKKLTTDQKVDLVLEKVIAIDQKVDKMQGDITDSIELTSSAMDLAAVTSDRVDNLENKKSPARIATQSVAGGFSPFTKGAFVA